MTHAAVTGGGAAAAHQAIVNAVKASGILVKVSPDDFMSILNKAESPLIVYSKGGVFKANHQYMVSYKGFAFHTKVPAPLVLPGKAQVVAAEKIWIPG
ncbi:hypothetical protein ACFL6I_09425 [candidate division KSB1 bacterium]